MSLEELIEIANPQHAHCATVLLLDTSGSMAGDKVKQLNDGLKFFKEDVYSDELARKRVDLAIVTFGSDVNVIHEFSSIEEFEPPSIEASGSTSMGKAILKAIDLIEQRKIEYKTKGIDYYRPWIFMITDGGPTDMQIGDLMWDEVFKKVQDGEANKKFLFFAVGVEPADMALLKQIAPPKREPVILRQKMFKEMFAWLSRSLGSGGVTGSKVGDQVALENPAGPKGWGEISTV